MSSIIFNTNNFDMTEIYVDSIKKSIGDMKRCAKQGIYSYHHWMTLMEYIESTTTRSPHSWGQTDPNKPILCTCPRCTGIPNPYKEGQVED